MEGSNQSNMALVANVGPWLCMSLTTHRGGGYDLVCSLMSCHMQSAVLAHCCWSRAPFLVRPWSQVPTTCGHILGGVSACTWGIWFLGATVLMPCSMVPRGTFLLIVTDCHTCYIGACAPASATPMRQTAVVRGSFVLTAV